MCIANNFTEERHPNLFQMWLAPQDWPTATLKIIQSIYMELAWHRLKHLNWVQVCITCKNSCQNLFCLPQKSCWRGHRKRSQTVRNDLDCFKLSKWSDESPLMGRPLRLLFYLGLPLSIQAAFPMHKPHNTTHYSMHHTVSCWTLCTPTVANQVCLHSVSHIIVGALHSINPEMYYTVFSQSTSHDFSVPHHCVNHDHRIFWCATQYQR